MATVQKANVVLDIPDEEIDQYLELGYRVIDESGRVVKKMVPHDLPFLQKYYLETEKKIVEFVFSLLYFLYFELGICN